MMIFLYLSLIKLLKINSQIGNKKLSDEYDFEVNYRLLFIKENNDLTQVIMLCLGAYFFETWYRPDWFWKRMTYGSERK